MADKRISQLTDRGTVANSDVVPIVVSGAVTTNKATISSIQTFMQGNLDLGVTSVGITFGTSGTDVNVTGSPVTSSGNITINLPTASATNRGALSSADWSTFNSKQQAITLTTTGTSGASTLVSGTLNIPNYSTDLSGYVTLDTTQTITAQKTFTTSGSSDTMIISHGSGSGFALDVIKAGNGEAIRVTKTSGSGNAMTISGGNFEAPTIVKTGGTSSQFLKADGSVDSSTYLTTGTASSTYVPYTGAAANVDLGIYNLTASAVNVNGSGSNAGVINLESNAIFPLVNGFGTIGSGTTNQFNFYQTTGAGVFRGAILSLNSITPSATRTFTLPDADGTLALTSSIPANIVTGTGAQGRVAYWDSTGVIKSDSLFQWNDFSKRLGIGRTPTVSLDVEGAGFFSGALGVGGALNGTSASFSSTTEASNASTASVVLAGGLGVAKNIRSAQNIIAEGAGGTIATLNGGDLQVYTSGNANFSSISSPSNGNMVLKVNIGATPINALTLASTGAATFSSSVTANSLLVERTASRNMLGISSISLPTSGAEEGVAVIKTNSSLWQMSLVGYAADSKGLRIYNTGGSGNTSLEVATAAGTAFIVNGSGNVGIGTASPPSDTRLTARATSSTGYNLFIEQDNGLDGFVLASTSAHGALTFSRRDTSGSNTTERTRITAGGYLKVSNTGSYANANGPYHEFLSNASNNNISYFINSASSNPYGPYIQFSQASPNDSVRYFLLCDDSTATRFQVRSNGGIASYQANDVNLSDERTKKDIEPLESYWDKFKAIEIVKFKYKDQTHDDFNIGVIAQQVESVAPEFVDVDGWGSKPELDGEGNEILSEEEPLKSIYTADLHHATIKVLQEAMAKIEKLETEIDSLKNQIK